MPMPTMMPPQGAEPAAGPEMGATGKTVCITANADGTFAVGDHDAYMAQSGGEEMGEVPEAPGMGAEKSGMKPAASIDEALDMARGLLEGGDGEGMSVEQAFQGGFSGEPAKGG